MSEDGFLLVIYHNITFLLAKVLYNPEIDKCVQYGSNIQFNNGWILSKINHTIRPHYYYSLLIYELNEHSREENFVRVPDVLFKPTVH